MRTWAIEMLTKAGVEAPHLNADELLAHCLGISRREVRRSSPQMNGSVRDLLQSLVGRRLNREPLQYILGHWGFWSMDLKITPAVMVPRPETESLVEEAIKVVRNLGRAPITILDIGTGSGNIAIALAHETPFSSVTATDISPEALSVAKDNALRCGLEERIEFIQGDLFNPISGRTFDIIISNPPYIPSAALSRLEPEVRDFEPRIALDGGEDGMDFYRKIISGAGEHLAAGGCLIVEAGDGQAEEIAEIMTEDGGFEGTKCSEDLLGIPRVVMTFKGNDG